MGSEILTAINVKSSLFCDIMQCSPLKAINVLAAYFKLDFLLAYFSILKLEAICSTKTSSECQRTTRRYISEDKILYVRVVSELTQRFSYVRLHTLYRCATDFMVWINLIISKNNKISPSQ
jgi:hypothetical protein